MSASASEPRRSPLARLAPRYAASLILCTVALLQIVLVYRFNLTPWKGGGFGMFSTVDSLDARYVKIYLISGERSIPAIPPPRLSTDYLRVQALPTQASVDKLAKRLADLPWIDAAAVHNRFQPQERVPGGDGGRGPTGREMARSAGRPGNSPRNDVPPGVPPRDMSPPPENTAGLPGPGLRNVRALEPIEPLPPGASVLRFDSLRLEVWRYDYTASSGELRALRLASATQPAPAGGP